MLMKVQRGIISVHDEAETGKLPAVPREDLDEERGANGRAEDGGADGRAEDGRAEARRAELERQALDRTDPERPAMDPERPAMDPERPAMDRADVQEVSSADIESETPVRETPARRPSSSGAFAGARPETPFLAEQTSAQAGARWQEILAEFVDDPRRAVGDAHQLVSQVMQRIVDDFARERDNLERQWSKGDDVSTEDLRVCLQSYRSFFARLLPADR
jgi:hypothetical protein